MLLFQKKNGSKYDFPYYVYCVLIMKTEVCHLAVCLRRNKQKSSVCKQTKQTEQTCPSMEIT